jgi:hypothetical protein
MDNPMRLDPSAAQPALTFDCGDLMVDEVVVAADMVPDGYFWEGVLRFVDPSLAEAVELDSESDMFSAQGPASTLEQVRDLMQPYVTDAAELARLIERAETAGFDLEDSEPEEPERPSFLRRLMGRS